MTNNLYKKAPLPIAFWGVGFIVSMANTSEPIVKSFTDSVLKPR